MKVIRSLNISIETRSRQNTSLLISSSKGDGLITHTTVKIKNIKRESKRQTLESLFVFLNSEKNASFLSFFNTDGCSNRTKKKTDLEAKNKRVDTEIFKLKINI